MKRIASAILIFFALLFPVFRMFGQSKPLHYIQGSLIDKNTELGVEYASVAVYSLPDTLLVTGTMTDSLGRFKLDRIADGEYLLKSGFVGYQSAVVRVTVKGEPLVFGDPLLLNPSVTFLNEAVVTAEKSEKRSSLEKTTINVSKNISSVSGSVSDVLASHSSITIDGDNTLYIRGNKNILLLIDGVPTTLSSLDAVPASNVDNIEVITNPDVRYDAEGTGGIINIVTKVKSISGFSGAVTLNYGLPNKGNGGINARYSKGIWDLGLSYNGKFSNENVVSSLRRNIPTNNLIVEQSINALQRNSTQSVGMQVNARPFKKNLFSFSAKFMTPKINNDQSLLIHQQYNFLKKNDFTRRNDITFSRKNFEGSFGYKRFFRQKRSELSFNAAYSKTKGSRPAYYHIDGQLLQKSSGGGAPTNYTLQGDYLHSLTNGGKIEAGAKFFSRWNDFNYEFYNLVPRTKEWELNHEFSNNLNHQEHIYSAYLMYSDTLLKRVSFKAGVRAEYNTTLFTQKKSGEEVPNSYFFPFPYLQIDFPINKFNALAFGINRRITRPTYPQLNPFIYMIDDMTYETGNKNLIPEVMDKVEALYYFKKQLFSFSTNLYYSRIKNFITQVSLLSDSRDLIMTYLNGDIQRNIGCDVSVGFSPSTYFSLIGEVSIYHTKSSGEYGGLDLSTDNLAWSSNIKATIRPEKKTDLLISFNYDSPKELPQFKVDRVAYADVALKRSFFKGKMSASITLTDVFNSRNWVIHSNNSFYKLNNISKNETRILWLGITFNFNSFKAKKPANQQSPSQERKVIRLGEID